MERVYELLRRLREPVKKAGMLNRHEQQMLAVPREIMAEPKVLLIDELSLGLAPVLVLGLFEMLIGYVLSQGHLESEGSIFKLAKK